MSKFARNSWRMNNKRNVGSVSSEGMSISSMEEDIPASTNVEEEAAETEAAEPCVQYARCKACSAGKKLNISKRFAKRRGKCSEEREVWI